MPKPHYVRLVRISTNSKQTSTFLISDLFLKKGIVDFERLCLLSLYFFNKNSMMG